MLVVQGGGKTLLEKYDHEERRVQLSLTLTPVYALAKTAITEYLKTCYPGLHNIMFHVLYFA